MMLVFCDNSCLSALAEMGMLEVLPRIVGPIRIPAAVAAEGRHPGAPEALRNDHCSIRVCDGGNGGVRGAVSGSQIKSVAGVVAEFVEANGQKTRQLGIDDEFHAAGRGSKRLILARRAA